MEQSSQSAQDPAALIAQIAYGDKSALKELYDSVGPVVHRFILSRIPDPYEATDVLQETMLDVWRQATKFEGRSSAQTWILAIARNKAIDRLRRQNRSPQVEVNDTIEDEAPNPHAVLEALDESAHLRECIADLQESQRVAIHLAFFEDLSYGEIAEIERCPEGTIKTRIYHAKRLLLRCLGKKGVSSPSQVI